MAVQHEELRQSLIDGCHITANHDTEDEEEAKATGNENDDDSMTEKKKETPQQETAEEEENEGNAKFNEDLLCEHGKFA